VKRKQTISDNKKKRELWAKLFAGRHYPEKGAELELEFGKWELVLVS